MRDRVFGILYNLGIWGDIYEYCDEIIEKYKTPKRPYHNFFGHIRFCLDQLEPLGGPFPGKTHYSMALALVLHDIIYDAKASDNEERSAAYAQDLCRRMRIEELGPSIAAMIMATAHREAPEFINVPPIDNVLTLKNMCHLVADIDMAILGQTGKKYADYEKNIRAEYSWASDGDYAKGRAEFLEKHARRIYRYHTEFFRKKYDQIARENLRQSYLKLGAS
jgi:predicted metal-dependent HD superfamily phosphohydrolase